MYLPSTRPRVVAASAAALVGLLTLSVGASSASAHGVSVTTPGAKPASERQLRALETRMLGPTHAAEHAAQRAIQRDPRERARLARAASAVRSRAGARRATASALDPGSARNGRWAAPTQLSTVAIHAALLGNGKVLMFGKNNRVNLWDPITNSNKSIDPPMINGVAANIFCAGQSFLADGRLLVTGGNLAYEDPGKTTYKGLNTVFIFDPLTERWTRQPDMREGRWYPTQVLLPDGRTVIMDGRDSSGVIGAAHNNDIEVFTPSPDRGKPGTITQLGRRSGAGQPPGGGLYPHMFVMPSGRTLVAGPQPEDSWFLNGLGAGFSFSWSDFANTLKHDYGSGVILPQDTPGSSQVEIIGGDSSFTSGKQVEVFDENNPAAGWARQPDLNQGRGHHNTVLLPDGSMVTVGGGVGTNADGKLSGFEKGHLDVELWNPADRTWRRGAAQLEGRAYHSTALLLPDGRVMSAGDDTNGGGDTDTAEIYSPPYLFDANGAPAVRPTIASTPTAVGYGQGFGVSFSGSDVARAVMIAPGAVTHGNDMSQRYVPLTVSGRTASSLTLTAPANANVAPPGTYMLFLVNSRGVPSEARFVQVAGGAPRGAAAPTSGTPTPGTAPAPAGGSGPASGPSLLRFSTLKRQTLRTVRSRGLQVTATCRRTCKVRAQLQLDRRTAYRLRLVRRRSGSSFVLIGTGSATVRRGHPGRVVVKLTPAAKRRLSRSRSLTVRLTLKATGTDRKTQTTIRRLTLKR